jgi:hypothetical protein
MSKETKRPSICQKRSAESTIKGVWDLVYVKRDLVYAKRDLVYVKRDLPRALSREYGTWRGSCIVLLRNVNQRFREICQMYSNFFLKKILRNFAWALHSGSEGR